MSKDNNTEQEQLASYFTDIDKKVKETDFKVLDNKTNIDIVDRLDLEQVKEAFESKDTVKAKTALYTFFQDSLSRGRTIGGIARLLGWNIKVVNRYYFDYIDWMHGVMGNTSLSVRIFDNAANDYKLAAAKLNRLVEICYMKAEKSIRDEKAYELCASYIAMAIKACTELASVQTKFQEICTRLGLHDRLKDYFYQVSNEDEFTKGKNIASRIEEKMRKRGVNDADLKILRERVDNLRESKQDQESKAGFEFLSNDV